MVTIRNGVQRTGPAGRMPHCSNRSGACVCSWAYRTTTSPRSPKQRAAPHLGAAPAPPVDSPVAAGAQQRALERGGCRGMGGVQEGLHVSQAHALPLASLLPGRSWQPMRTACRQLHAGGEQPSPTARFPHQLGILKHPLAVVPVVHHERQAPRCTTRACRRRRPARPRHSRLPGARHAPSLHCSDSPSTQTSRLRSPMPGIPDAPPGDAMPGEAAPLPGDAAAALAGASVANHSWSCVCPPASASVVADATSAGMPTAGMPEPRRPSAAGLQAREAGRRPPVACRSEGCITALPGR